MELARPTVRALVAYDGTEFAGFQRQAVGRTVQAELERALHALYGASVIVRAAGRTDAGVHARGQVVTWQGLASLPAERAAFAVRRYMPRDVAVRDSELAPADWDPRRMAVRRIYRYRFVVDRWADPLRDRFVLRVKPGMDLAAVMAGAEMFVGVHEFGSFCTVGGSEGPTLRAVQAAELHHEGPVLVLEWQARSFLRKQVRCMMGALFALGRGAIDAALLKEMLAGRPWPPGLAVAPAHGLTLERVEY